MDYHNFGSQQGGFGFPPSSAGHSPQHTQHADPHGRLQQATPSFPYAQFNGQAYSSNMGSHAPAGGALPFTQALPAALQQPAYAHALPSPAQQHFAQNPQTASPSAISGHPYATPQAPPTQGTLPSNGHQQQPMNQPRSEAPQVQTPVKAVTHSPVSPVAQARNQDRVTTLLEINSILIKEVCELQSQGKAGQVGPPTEGKAEGDKPQASKEYIDFMRRLQANLAYLAQNAEKNQNPGKPMQPGPAIMSPPTAPPELTKLYQKLIELFPGWKGQTAQVKQSPGPQRMNSAASTTSQPPNSAGLQQNWSQTAMQNMHQAQAQANAKVEQ